jgi:GAF domain-containing protein
VAESASLLMRCLFTGTEGSNPSLSARFGEDIAVYPGGEQGENGFVMSDDLLDLDLGLRELTSLLLSEETLATTLDRVTAVAQRCVTGGDGATVTLVKGGSPYTAFHSDGRVLAVDERQYEFHSGPTLEALKTGELQIATCGDADERWDELLAYAAACGVGSILAVPLVVGSEVVGSLNVYSESTRAFGPDEVSSAVLLAGQASVSVANAKAHEECVSRIQQLQEALDSRVVIEQAKGVLMERHRLSPDDAFDRLRERSQRENVKLREVAAGVVATIAAPAG